MKDLAFERSVEDRDERDGKEDVGTPVCSNWGGLGK